MCELGESGAGAAIMFAVEGEYDCERGEGEVTRLWECDLEREWVG